MKKILEIIKKILKIIFLEGPFIKMTFSFMLFIVGLAISQEINDLLFFHIGLIFLGYGLIIFIIGLVYAYIINIVKEKKDDN